jgi:hypothetical protein
MTGHDLDRALADLAAARRSLNQGLVADAMRRLASAQRWTELAVESCKRKPARLPDKEPNDDHP